MHYFPNRALDTYEENKIITSKISVILSARTSSSRKEKLLKELYSSADTALARSQITYYRQKLRNKKRSVYGCIAVSPLILFYFLHMAYRTYYDLHPEKPHYDFSLLLSSEEQAGMLMFVPVFFLLYYIVRYAVAQRMLKRIYMKYIGILCIAVLAFATVYILNYRVQVIPASPTSEILIELPAESESFVFDEFIDIETEYVSARPTTLPDAVSSVQPDAFIGTWYDLTSQRCWMTIEWTWDNYYDISIHWSSSATENHEWRLSGFLDETSGIIEYSGDLIHSLYYDDGTNFKEFVYTDGSGIFYLDQDHRLYWQDYKEKAGAECVFEKYEPEIME